MSDFDPAVERRTVIETQPGHVDTVETVIVRRESSNLGWWIAGGLAALILLAVIWLLATRPAETTTTDL
ncbi:MAG: hypothetical protein EON88_20550, partial [Brevundimonas sp.]